MSDQTRAAIANARDEFLAMVGSIRPELHRYCARLTGSVIDGEDIVQETLAKAFYRLSLTPEAPPLRPWLFRIAHNTALDFLKSHGTRLTDPTADLADIAGVTDEPDRSATRVALARFLTLPVIQRSAVILKDVLDHSLAETAETMETTVMAVKAALFRGRANLRAADAVAPPSTDIARAELDRYVQLFNAGDWDGIRALVSADCRLDLVSASERRGKEVHAYLDRYATRPVSLRVVRLDGQLVLAAYRGASAAPSHIILLTFTDGLVTAIRDFRHVEYIAAEAEFTDA